MDKGDYRNPVPSTHPCFWKSALSADSSPDLIRNVRIRSNGKTLAASMSVPRWGSGPFPAIVCVHGSQHDAEDLRLVWRNLVPEEFVVLTYEKYSEEAGTDGGEQLQFMADDVLACREFLRKHPLVDPNRVGLFGGNHAGWIIPIACHAQKDVPFGIIFSEPVTPTTIGPACSVSLPVLSRLSTPTLWLFGQKERSMPARRSAMLLRNLRAQGVPITIKVYGHGIDSPSTYWTDVVSWLRQQGILVSEDQVSATR